MAQDLRSYLDRVKADLPDDFVTIPGEMDPSHEVTATVAKVEKVARKRPVMLFENVKGTNFPVITNLHASRKRLAMAMNCRLRKCSKPI